MARVSLAVVFVIIGVVNAMGVLAAVAVQEEGVAVLRAAYATTRHPVSPRMGRRRWVREDGSVDISGSPKYKQLRQEVIKEFSSNAAIIACGEVNQETFREARNTGRCKSRAISGSPKYRQM
ncbi:hypothetical protein HBI38_220650 [Parastagonospora nodorum]|nr:hypothetical protein HBI03_226320 [Parastagonospora nodorum]KAH4256804.1 hypothetical protein HBI04_226820 [Parastagonospora nodorum]KAH5139270.1 hypothetical protein HBH69_219810 [Parastagonospora nodorum]KAH5295513.1 hypothetical protein HBI50_231840 [Parastagonospora nodorum]KAH6301055.1 hypothetical protein HBI38_220650 [Parastagonospora nodorum]